MFKFLLKLHPKGFMAVLLSFLIIISPLSVVFAADLTNIEINGTTVYSMMDGYNAGHGISGVTFDDVTKILTLDNAVVQNISAMGDLTINLIGDSQISSPTDTTALLVSNGNLTIIGNGATLTVSGHEPAGLAISLFSGFRLTIGNESSLNDVIIVNVPAGMCNNIDDTYIVGDNVFNYASGGGPGDPPPGPMTPFKIFLGEDLIIDETADPQIVSNSGPGWTVAYFPWTGYFIEVDSDVLSELPPISGQGDGSIALFSSGPLTVNNNLGWSIDFIGNVTVLFAQDEDLDPFYLTGGIHTGGSVIGGDGDIFIGTEDTFSPNGISASEVRTQRGDITIFTDGTALNYFTSEIMPGEGMRISAEGSSTLKVAASAIATEDVIEATVLTGGTIDLNYTIESGDFASFSGYWTWSEFSGTSDENTMPTIVPCIEGTDAANYYILTLAANRYLLQSTSKVMYNVGYNYADSEDSRVVNGRVNIIAANGYKMVADEGRFFDFMIEEGTEVTIELIPDYGYQYVSGGINGNPTFPEAGRASYSFIMPANHIHISAIFEPSNDLVSLGTTAITAAAFELPEGTPINGNAEFLIQPVVDVNTSGFTPLANGFTLSYLDLSLNELIYKGATSDAWRTEISELDEEMVIQLTLSDQLKGHAEYKVLREHNGTVTEIPAVYDPATGTLSFSTNGFSVYALAFNDPANPNTFDGIGSQILMAAFSLTGLLGLGIATKKNGLHK